MLKKKWNAGNSLFSNHTLKKRDLVLRLAVGVCEDEVKFYPIETIILPGSANLRLHTSVIKETVSKNV
jgi:hypothetical protein